MKRFIEWVVEALKQSHTTEKKFHDQSVRKLRNQHDKLQERLDKMYVDKLDGRISDSDFDRLAEGWRKEQDEIDAAINALYTTNRLYIEDGVMLMDLARRASELFERQAAKEKRRLLNFLLSNCSWKHGELSYEFKQPFDMIAKVNSQHAAPAATQDAETGKMEKWLPGLDSNQ